MKVNKYLFFITNAIEVFLSAVKIVFLSKWSNNSIESKKNKSCCILGNGPSIKNSLKDQIELLQGKELFCVNHFAETEVYANLKPSNYVLNAPEMWMDDVEDFYKRKGEKLFSAIAQNTYWPINLFIPYSAKKFKGWQDQISVNDKITIHYFNTTPVDGFERFCFFCYKNGLGLPRPHNVLIPTILLACNMNYDQIILLGADHSWLKDIWVTENNEVLLTQKHFYDESLAKALPMDNLGKGQRKLYEVLQKFVYSFRGYFKLRAYAEKKGVDILNATPESYIDAFERLK